MMLFHRLSDDASTGTLCRVAVVAIRACVVVLVMWSVAACHGIREIRPKQGLPGTVVEIRGTGFSSQWHENEVAIGGSVARVTDGARAVAFFRQR
jgi:hypothetical protein